MFGVRILVVELVHSFLIYQTAVAEYTLLHAQNDTFNSTATITPTQQQQAGINATLAANVALALEFERSNFANGSVASEDFYDVPPASADATPGTLLKLELDANASAYTLPPNTAISRIMFQSEDLNGTAVPVSAYVLWPYLPRSQADGFPIVAWAHGSSGGFGNCAPSHYRNLLYQFAAPFELALQGYVVVAPDYLGLGVTEDAKGRPLVIPYLGSPSHANDLFYGVQAAQSAFSTLSHQFVVMGHSEGGGAAWAAATRQAEKPVPGYLGAVVGSPVTDLFGLINGMDTNARFATLITRSLSDLHPTCDPAQILTAAGLAHSKLYADLQGCWNTGLKLFADSGLLQANWTSNPYARAYATLTNPSGKAFAGPMLVLQGEADAAVPFPVTTAAVSRTCELYPDSALEYATFAGVDHVPVLFASQHLWLDWIGARFAGQEVAKGCRRQNYSSARPYEYYQQEQNWFVEFATDAYETA